MGLPSRRDWLVALRRTAWLIAFSVSFFGVESLLFDRLLNWLAQGSRLDAYRWANIALHPINLTAFLAVTLGLFGTVGSLVVASIPAARRPFRRIGAALGTALRLPRVTKVAPWLPGIIASCMVTRAQDLGLDFLPGHAVGLLAVTLSTYALARRWLRRLEKSEASADEELTEVAPDAAHAPSDSHFAAVAVTRLTRGLVGGALLSSLAMLVTAYVMPTPWLTGTHGLSLLAAYVALMLVLPIALRRSRILAGIDGVLVLGAGRPTFHAYAEHDEVAQQHDDIVLMRRGKPQLRLQLDDADRARAPKLVERLREAMTRAAEMSRQGAEEAVRPLVEGGSQAIATSARGATDYRKPAIVREQLWALVEGPLSDAGTRLVAAEALVHDLREGDAPRLRVAATGCAEQRVRLALEKLAATEDADEEDDRARAGALRLGTRLPP